MENTLGTKGRQRVAKQLKAQRGIFSASSPRVSGRLRRLLRFLVVFSWALGFRLGFLGFQSFCSASLRGMSIASICAAARGLRRETSEERGGLLKRGLESSYKTRRERRSSSES